MTQLTLLAKIYNSHQMKHIDGILEDIMGDLAVEAKVVGTSGGRWVLADISGEDEGVALKLLEREIGFCPVSIDKVKKFAGLKGFLTGLDRSSDAITADIGVFQPKPVAVTIAIDNLLTNLADGKRLPLKKLSELWGLSENLPLEIKILEVDTKEDIIEGELQEKQINKMLSWKDSLLDRLLVLGASVTEINAAIDYEGLGRDVIDVEKLGVFEHALVCKLGTDATGLVGNLGRHLRKAKFTTFNPKNLQ